MRRIIDNKLYDTKTSKMIGSFCEEGDKYLGKFYKTKNGAYFYTYGYGNDRDGFNLTTRDHVKRAFGRCNVEAYIEEFGEVEEG